MNSKSQTKKRVRKTTYQLELLITSEMVRRLQPDFASIELDDFVNSICSITKQPHTSVRKLSVMLAKRLHLKQTKNPVMYSKTKESLDPLKSKMDSLKNVKLDLTVFNKTPKAVPKVKNIAHDLITDMNENNPLIAKVIAAYNKQFNALEQSIQEMRKEFIAQMNVIRKSSKSS